MTARWKRQRQWFPGATQLVTNAPAVASSLPYTSADAGHSNLAIVTCSARYAHMARGDDQSDLPMASYLGTSININQRRPCATPGARAQQNQDPTVEESNHRSHEPYIHARHALELDCTWKQPCEESSISVVQACRISCFGGWGGGGRGKRL